MSLALSRLLLLTLALVAWLISPAVPAATAAPVEWHEVPATAAGRQWWDSGSLRLDRDGRLSVLSRFQPAPGANGEEPERPPAATLYVMQLDCDQQLFRDVSVNGLPRFRAEWQAVAGDDLGAAVIREACAAWAARP
ncbi:MAG: hypothetical protein VKJ05_00835 [Synechococcaceae cyanobacterium]|nr:hypothetical protein [Synechococcaceae cyanobacterium]